MSAPDPTVAADVVSIQPGPGGWPGEAADYMRACPFVRDGYGLVDVAMDALNLHGWRLERHAHLPMTCAEWERLAGMFGTDHAIPIAGGYSLASSYAIRAMLTAWRRGYTIRSVYRKADYPPPADA